MEIASLPDVFWPNPFIPASPASRSVADTRASSRSRRARIVLDDLDRNGFAARPATKACDQWVCLNQCVLSLPDLLDDVIVAAQES